MLDIKRKDNAKLVEIVFDDPAEYDTNYDKNKNPIECRTIGWLVDESPSYIQIIWLREGDDEPYVGLSIPKGCIKKIYPINTLEQVVNPEGRGKWCYN